MLESRRGSLPLDLGRWEPGPTFAAGEAGHREEAQPSQSEERPLCSAESGHCVFIKGQTHTSHNRQEIRLVQLGGERELTVYQGHELTRGHLSPHFPLL